MFTLCRVYLDYEKEEGEDCPHANLSTALAYLIDHLFGSERR
jgi:hypothetical protein